jgi:hypothetical protein
MKKMKKVDGSDEKKTELIKFEFLMDPYIPDSKYSLQFTIFKDRFPKDGTEY